MSLKIAKNNAPAYDYISEGDGSDPATISATLNNQGGTLDSNVLTYYLVATTFNYTGISVQPITENAGIDWKVSLNNVNWFDSVSPANMDARVTDQVTTIYLKAVVNNNGTVATGNYTSADVRVASTENP